MLTWERLTSEQVGIYGMDVVRSKVPGGWLLFFEHYTGAEIVGSSTFYPDPDHSWDGSSLP
jgi:hypothetical protein